jgi:hypothetical protein
LVLVTQDTRNENQAAVDRSVIRAVATRMVVEIARLRLGVAVQPM